VPVVSARRPFRQQRWWQFACGFRECQGCPAQGSLYHPDSYRGGSCTSPGTTWA